MIVADLLDREEQRTPVHWYDSATIELCLIASLPVERWVFVIDFPLNVTLAEERAGRKILMGLKRSPMLESTLPVSHLQLSISPVFKDGTE
jgi:hypothetical protein